MGASIAGGRMCPVCGRPSPLLRDIHKKCSLRLAPARARVTGRGRIFRQVTPTGSPWPVPSLVGTASDGPAMPSGEPR